MHPRQDGAMTPVAKRWRKQTHTHTTNESPPLLFPVIFSLLGSPTAVGVPSSPFKSERPERTGCPLALSKAFGAGAFPAAYVGEESPPPQFLRLLPESTFRAGRGSKARHILCKKLRWRPLHCHQSYTSFWYALPIKHRQSFSCVVVDCACRHPCTEACFPQFSLQRMPFSDGEKRSVDIKHNKQDKI